MRLVEEYKLVGRQYFVFKKVDWISYCDKEYKRVVKKCRQIIKNY